jgi:phospholipid-translocating ATPase
MAVDFDGSVQQAPVVERAETTQTSQPLNRMRWATVRNPGRKGTNKRRSIFSRNAARLSASHRNRESAVTDDSDMKVEEIAEKGAEEETSRTIYVNQPLPESARDEEGHPLQNFTRNKIRTAKYTPLSFIPKNLWFQLHNIANVYFIFIVILGVSGGEDFLDG